MHISRKIQLPTRVLEEQGSPPQSCYMHTYTHGRTYGWSYTWLILLTWCRTVRWTSTRLLTTRRSTCTVCLASAVHKLEDCISEVGHWMSAIRLKLNADKTELLWVGSRHNWPHLESALQLLDQSSFDEVWKLTCLPVFSVSLRCFTYSRYTNVHLLTYSRNCSSLYPRPRLPAGGGIINRKSYKGYQFHAL